MQHKLLFFTNIVYLFLTPNRVKKRKFCVSRRKRMFSVFNIDFCIAKNSSLLSIPKLNVVAIKENCKEKTCGCHSYLRMAFLLMEAI